jgi:general secretion pathway protein K
MTTGRQTGVALLAVLWLIAVLSLLAGAVVVLTVSHRRLEYNYAEALRRQEINDSALRLTLLQLNNVPQVATADSAERQFSMEVLQHDVNMSVWHEDGRIDLNTADADLLFAVFAAAGWSEKEAHNMAARIVDWRDADDTPQEGGAESDAYSAAGLSYGPRNGRFESVDEVRQVMGGQAISEDLLSAFTIYTGASTPVESDATGAAKQALEWADRVHLGDRQWLQRTNSPAGSETRRWRVDGTILRIRACLQSSGGGSCREVVTRLTGKLSRPWQIFSWRTISAN